MSNIWSDDWESLGETEWEAGTKSTRLPRGDVLGASVYELPPGGRTTYHFHHGSEEILIALQGRVTLRTPDGERELEEGEVVHFPSGPTGAHEQLNRTDGPVRYLVMGNRVSPEVVEYPDTRQDHSPGPARLAARRAAVADPRARPGLARPVPPNPPGAPPGRLLASVT